MEARGKKKKGWEGKKGAKKRKKGRRTREKENEGETR
jgi:hypothetical protein